jgi:CCR4-NOT transcription complex subunit 1
MRVLLVLLHDFPEFLCEYHYAFCDVIPPNCIQVRNLVLSAFPRNMRLPDPFTPNLKVDTLPDIAHVPPIMSNFVNFIQPQSFKKVGLGPFLGLCCVLDLLISYRQSA